MDAEQFRTYMRPEPGDDMTERELQEQVRLMCSHLGLYHYHTHDSRRSQASFPDCVILNMRTGQIMFRELKTQTGTLTPDRVARDGTVIPGQRAVGYALQAFGHDWAVWRPADLLDGSIGAELARLAGHKVRA